MERSIILKNTVTGQELTLPVTPPRYPMEAGRTVEHIDMAQTGQIALPGLKRLLNENLEAMFPAQKYPFCTAGAVADPNHYISLLCEWSRAGNVCRYIVTGTEVNVPVLLGPIRYEERDGTNDVYATIPLHGYSYLDEVRVENTQNLSRPPAGTEELPEVYVAEAGDSMWSIAKKMYGDSSLAIRLVDANGVANPNAVMPGQPVFLPQEDTLRASAESNSVIKRTDTVEAARAEIQATLELDSILWG